MTNKSNPCHYSCFARETFYQTDVNVTISYVRVVCVVKIISKYIITLCESPNSHDLFGCIELMCIVYVSYIKLPHSTEYEVWEFLVVGCVHGEFNLIVQAFSLSIHAYTVYTYSIHNLYWLCLLYIFLAICQTIFTLRHYEYLVISLIIWKCIALFHDELMRLGWYRI